MISVSNSTKQLAGGAALVLLELLAGIALILCLTERPVMAYADPGSGAVLLQLFFAAIVSIGFHFRKLRSWFGSFWPRR